MHLDCQLALGGGGNVFGKLNDVLGMKCFVRIRCWHIPL